MNRHLLAGLSTLLLPMSQYAAAFNTRGSYQRTYLAEAVNDALRLSARSSSLKARPMTAAQVSELDVLAGEPARELVVIDAAVPDKRALFEQVRPGVDVVELAADRDGLQQLQDVLSKYHNLQAVHIVSHAEAGVLLLGSSRITAETIQHEMGVFSSLTGAVRDGGDLLFYGCDLAANQSGEALLDIIRSNTHLDVAASNDRTGSAALDGDWDLEIQRGEIDTKLAFSPKALLDFSGVLAPTEYTALQIHSAAGAQYSRQSSLSSPDSKIVFSSPGGGEVSAYDNYSTYGSLYSDSGSPDYTARPLQIAVDSTHAGSFELHELKLCSIDFSNTSSYITVYLHVTGYDASDVAVGSYDASVTTMSCHNATDDHYNDFNAIDLSSVFGSNFDLKRVVISYDTAPAGSEKFILKTVTLDDIKAPNAAPTATGIPADVTVTEDTASNFDLSAITFADADGDSLTITLDAGAGTFTSISGGGVTVGGSGTGELTLNGTAANINTFLDAASNIQYTGALNVNGNNASTITVNANDGTVNPSLGTINVDITAVNDAPVVTVPGSISINEDASITLTGISFADPDAGAGTVTATFSVPSGAFSAVSGSGVTVGGTAPALTLTGTIADINAFIAADGLSYTTASNATADVELTVSINDGGNTGGAPLSDSDTTTLQVTAINDAPVATVPGSISVTEDVSTALTGISFADQDAGTADVTVTLSVPSGTLAAISGGGVIVGGSTSSALTLTGTIADINAFIAASGVSYTTASNATTDVTLTVSIDDGGNTGAGSATTDSGTVTLHVTPVNDAPTDIALNLASIDESATTAGAAVGTLTSTDSDSGDTHTYALVANGSSDNGSCGATGDDGNASFQIDNANDELETVGSLSAGSYNVCVETDDGTASYQETFTITVNDDVAPTVSSVGVPANGTYTAGQNLDFTVNTNENVTVAGSPRIELTVGATTRHADYISGSGTSALVFRYTVQAGDNDADGIAVAASVDANGGTLRDGAGNDLNTTLNSVGSTAAVLVDAAMPTVSSVTVPANATYRAGQNLDFTVNTNENVTVNSGGGTPRIALTVGATTRYATYISGSGTSAVVFRYTVQAGDSDTDGIAVAGSVDANGGTLRDGAGNDLNTILNSVGSTAAVLVDAVVPTVSSVSVPANATYSTGQNLDFTVNTNENVTVSTATGTPQIALTIGATTRQAAYLSGSGTSALVFAYTVQAGDADSDGIAVATTINANSGTLRDAAGNDLTLTLNSVGDTSAVLVDTGAPVNNLPAAQTTDSVTQLVFSSANGNAISVTDAGNLTVVISVDSGTLTASTSGAAGISNNGTDTVTMTGTAAEVNAALEGLIYTPDGAGTRTFNIQSTDAAGNVDDDDLDLTVNAGTFLVTSNLDTGDDETAAGSLAADQADGNGLSIREALHWARAQDTITFDLDSGTPGNQGGTIILDGSQLTVAYSNLRIDGDVDDDGSADVTLSGNNASRVMAVNTSLTGIELSGLTLTQGNGAGGGGLAIGNNTSITVRDSNITNNTESGLGGGGIYGSTVTLTVFNSTISGNSSVGFGGGIRAVGASVLNVINSTVSGNTTTGPGSHGGGIEYAGSTLTLINSTISGNAVTGAGADGGGLRISSGNSSIYNTTIVGNAATNSGGGVSANGTTDTFINTVVAGNTAGAGATPGVGGSPLATGGLNNDIGGTIEVATNSYFGTNAAITTNNSSLNNQGTANLLLGDLADNGGNVRTHFPQPGSALLEAGNNAALPADTYDLDGDSDTAEALPVDANGNARVSDIVDIGAVEGDVPPAVTSVGVPANDTYIAGESLDFAVNIDENIIVDTTGGTPQIALTIGSATRQATYVSGSGTSVLVFRYVLQAGDTDVDGIAVASSIDTNGGTLRNAADEDLDIALNALGSTASVLVDAIAPNVSSVTVPANGTYLAGQNIDFTVNYDDNVSVTGTPRLALTIGATTRYATYISGSGSSAVLFRYTVQAGDNDANGIALSAILDTNGGTVEDAAGNAAGTNLGTVGSLAAVLVDAQAPSVNSVMVPANATYTAGQNLDFTVVYDETVTVNTAGGTPRLALTVGATTRYSNYISGSGTTAVVFRYTVQAGDNDTDGVAVGAAIDANGGTLQDSSGIIATPTLNNVDSTAGVLVDASAPSAPSTPDLDAASDTGISSSDNLTRDTTPTFTGTAEANSTVTVISDRDGTLGTTTASGDGDWTFTVATPLSDGTHSITATAEDGVGNTSPASAALAITIDTTSPTVSNDTVATDEDNSVAINVLANDGDADSHFNAASVTVVSAPSAGSTSVNTGTGVITYTPNADFNGTDSFTYTVVDLQKDISAPAAVTITVNAVNDAPDAAGDTASTNEGTAVLIDVASNDGDRGTADAVDPTTLAVASAPIHGVAAIESGSIRYTPPADFSGTDTFTYTIEDSHGAASAAATVVVNVGSANNPPSAGADAASTAEDTAVVIDVLANDSDADGTLNVASVQVLDAPGHGTADVNATSGAITYTPAANFNGTDTFKYVVRDNGDASSNAATVTITVAPVNDAPVALNDTASVQVEVPHRINVLGNDSDVDGTLIISSVSVGTTPADGSVSVDTTSGAITYTPNTGFGGSDSFTYRVRDNSGAWSQYATVTLTGSSVNDDPLANDDSAITDEDTAVDINVLNNDSDIDGVLDATAVMIGIVPTHGTATVNADGSVTYTPAENWNGADSFTYSVADNGGVRSNVAMVSVLVNAVNDLPVISGTPANTISSGQAYAFTPSLGDPDGQALTVTATNLPGWASLNASTGAITGTPGFDDAGTYSGIVLTVSDGIGTSSLPAFAIVVVAASDFDGDGISDVFEGTYGLDPTDPSDGSLDLDGDGISNLDEYVANTDPTTDDYPPQLSSPAPITIDATGLLTRAPSLTPPPAIDGRDGTLTATLVDERDFLEPGTHVVTWHATDAAGNRGETLQAINVRPLISLARDQVTAEGATAQVRVLLNGPSPIYPLSVGYEVGGTADAEDHDLVAGTVVFQLGELEKTIAVQIASDGIAESDETIEVSLTGDGNFGTQRTHTIRIVEANHAPSLAWSIMQGGRSVRIVTQDQGAVTLAASVYDANASDTHIYEWSIPAGVIATDVSDAVKTFDPALVAPGVYRVELTVTDNGTPALSTRGAQLFQVIATAPALSDSADADGDGLDDAAEGLTDQDGDGQPDYLDANASPNVLYENVGDGGLFLIEADPGVQLSLGSRALTQGADGAQITNADITIADSIVNVGGYFDLTISGLPEVNASVNVVIPQRAAIPQHPLYRKFINGQWVTFVENAANQLASAPGERGVCPPPGSSAYRPGLNSGDWCVRLTLEDGGPNDADGIANGAVEDPGGVGRIHNVTSTTRGGGGGAVGTPLLMLLLLLALHRLRDLSAKRAGAWVAMGLALAVVLPMQASADERSLYVTGLLGRADTNISASDVERAFAGQNIESTVHSVDGERLAWSVGVGYQISDRWSVEAGYLDLGEVKLSFDTLATETNLAQVHPLSANGTTISGLHQMRFGDRVTARARLGAFIWSADYTTRTGDETVDTDDDSGIDLLWGIAVGYDLSSAWSLDLELQRIELDEPTDVIGLQAQWRIHSF